MRGIENYTPLRSRFRAVAPLSLTIKGGIARLRLMLTVIRPENDFYELVILSSTQLYMGTIKLHRKGTMFLHQGILYFYTTPYYKITLLPICYIDRWVLYFYTTL